MLKTNCAQGVEARGSSMSTALGGTTKGRSKNLATPPTQPEYGGSSGRLSSAEKGAAAWGMGSWAPAEPISPYGALMGDPYCAPTMRAPTEEARINPAHLSQIARPRCAPTRRAHNVRSHCAPIWVIWGPLTPYGFIDSHMGPHTAALVEKGARAVSGRTTLSRALESFYFEPSGGRTSPRQFQPPSLDSLLRVDSPSLLCEKAARRTARRSLGRTTRLGRPNNLALPSHPDSLQISRKHQSLKSTPR